MDTGNSGGLFVSRSYAESKGWLKDAQLRGVRVRHDRQVTEAVALAPNERRAQGSTGAGDVETFSIPKLKLGPYELVDVLVTVPAADQTSTAGRRERHSAFTKGTDSKGLLGYDVLKHFVVTLDLKRMKMHLALPE